MCCAPEDNNKTTALSNSKSVTDTGGAINVNIANNDESHVNSHGNNIAIGTNIGINGGQIIGDRSRQEFQLIH